jgi:polyvinyl alcohol dehydrogenase (cytochrome)
LLVVASTEGSAWGIDQLTGRVRWSRKLSNDKYAGSISDLLAYNGKVYIGMSSVDEVLFGKVPGFTATSVGSVMALDSATGATVWQTYTVQPPATGGAVWSSFALDTATMLLYCNTGNNYTGPATDTSDALIALDAFTGRLVWKQQVTANDIWLPGQAIGADDDFGAGPQLFQAPGPGGTTLSLVGAGQKTGAYWAFDRATGAPVWHAGIGGGFDGIRGEAGIGGGRVIAWSNYKAAGPARPTRVMALDPSTGAVLWTRTANQAMYGAAAGFLSNDVYFAGDSQGIIRAYRATTGTILWTGATPGRSGCASSLVVQGKFLYAGLGLHGFGGNNGPMGLESFRVP